MNIEQTDEERAMPPTPKRFISRKFNRTASGTLKIAHLLRLQVFIRTRWPLA